MKDLLLKGEAKYIRASWWVREHISYENDAKLYRWVLIVTATINALTFYPSFWTFPILFIWWPKGREAHKNSGHPISLLCMRLMLILLALYVPTDILTQNWIPLVRLIAPLGSTWVYYLNNTRPPQRKYKFKLVPQGA